LLKTVKNIIAKLALLFFHQQFYKQIHGISLHYITLCGFVSQLHLHWLLLLGRN